MAHPARSANGSAGCSSPHSLRRSGAGPAARPFGPRRRSSPSPFAPRPSPLAPRRRPSPLAPRHRHRHRPSPSPLAVAPRARQSRSRSTPRVRVRQSAHAALPLTSTPSDTSTACLSAATARPSAPPPSQPPRETIGLALQIAGPARAIGKAEVRATNCVPPGSQLHHRPGSSTSGQLHGGPRGGTSITSTDVLVSPRPCPSITSAELVTGPRPCPWITSPHVPGSRPTTHLIQVRDAFGSTASGTWITSAELAAGPRQCPWINSHTSLFPRALVPGSRLPSA